MRHTRNVVARSVPTTIMSLSLVGLSTSPAIHSLLRSSPASDGGVVGRRCVDLGRAEGVQAAAAALHRQEGPLDGASPRSLLNRTRRPQGLVQLRRRPRHAGSLMQLRVVQSGRTVLRDAVLRVARSIMRSSSCGSTAPLSLSCTSVVYGGGAGCAPIWPTSSLSRAARFMRARALCPCSLRLLWGRLARSERTDLHHLPPLLWHRGPPVPAVMRCMEVSTVPSARLCCSDRASPGSSRARRRPRRPTQVACDARATAPVPAEES